MYGMQLLEPLARHMGINLRCGNIRMPQQHLHYTKISTMVEQMRSKCVA